MTEEVTATDDNPRAGLPLAIGGAKEANHGDTDATDAVAPPPAVTVAKTAAPIDADGSLDASPGDAIRHTCAVMDTGTAHLPDVTLSDDPLGGVGVGSTTGFADITVFDDNGIDGILDVDAREDILDPAGVTAITDWGDLLANHVTNVDKGAWIRVDHVEIFRKWIEIHAEGGICFNVGL